MKVLVTGAGRGGTNLGIELFRNTKAFNPTKNVEDRNFFTKKSLPDKYLTKLATENSGFTKENINKMMKNNPDLYIVFIFRNPIDNCLSKILRGQPKSKGGDSAIEKVAPDGTLEGSINSLKHMHKIYYYLKKEYGSRVFTIKMEDLILNPKDVSKRVCKNLNIPFNESMLDFYKTNRNGYQAKRYGKKLVKNIDLYKDLDNNFNKFFKDKKNYVHFLEKEFDDIIIKMKY